METMERASLLEARSRELTPPLKLSLVLATMGRTVELSNFLTRLDCQSYRNFELIVVDQNPDDRLIPVLAPYCSRFAIKHLRSQKGLSRARNVGLRYISGDVVAFPDDDCWYQPGTLAQVAALLLDHSDWDGVTGRASAPKSFRHLDRQAGYLNKFNVWRRATSITIFLSASVVQMVGDFDLLLGAGAESGLDSAEEMDYLLRALEKQCRIYYQPDLLVNHPDVLVYDDKSTQKGYSYSRGLGYTLRKHRYPFWYVSYCMLRAFGAAVLFLGAWNVPKAKYHWAVFRGRLSAWLE